MQQCTDCDGGTYCAHEAATNFTDLCWPGYYCESGVDRPNPNNANVNNSNCSSLGGHTGNTIYANNICFTSVWGFFMWIQSVNAFNVTLPFQVTETFVHAVTTVLLAVSYLKAAHLEHIRMKKDNTHAKLAQQVCYKFRFIRLTWKHKVVYLASNNACFITGSLGLR